MKTILVLGKGYISSKIEKYWSLEKDEYRLIRVSKSEFDYTSPVGFKNMIDTIGKPYFIINTFGFTGKPNVDACEPYPISSKCYGLNGDANKYITHLSKEYNIDFINISTGCLYNDEHGKIFTEDDDHNFGHQNPTSSVYSKSKSLYENYFNKFIQEVNNRNYLLRIRMPFDDEMDDKNYINKIIKYDKLINYPNSVTYIPDLVGFIETIITKSVPMGIYNVVNKNPIKAEKVIAIWNEFEGNNKQIDRWYSVDDLLSLGLMKCRRSNCVLSTEKIEKYYPELQYSGTAVIKAIRDNLERNK